MHTIDSPGREPLLLPFLPKRHGRTRGSRPSGRRRSGREGERCPRAPASDIEGVAEQGRKCRLTTPPPSVRSFHEGTGIARRMEPLFACGKRRHLRSFRAAAETGRREGGRIPRGESFLACAATTRKSAMPPPGVSRGRPCRLPRRYRQAGPPGNDAVLGRTIYPLTASGRPVTVPVRQTSPRPGCSLRYGLRGPFGANDPSATAVSGDAFAPVGGICRRGRAKAAARSTRTQADGLVHNLPKNDEARIDKVRRAAAPRGWGGKPGDPNRGMGGRRTRSRKNSPPGASPAHRQGRGAKESTDGKSGTDGKADGRRS